MVMTMVGKGLLLLHIALLIADSLFLLNGMVVRGVWYFLHTNLCVDSITQSWLLSYEKERHYRQLLSRSVGFSLS